VSVLEFFTMSKIVVKNPSIDRKPAIFHQVCSKTDTHFT
jgi:hypothetical protein